MIDVTVKKIRETFRRLESKERITRDILEVELGISDNVDKRRFRDALKQMVRKGELTLYDDGSYRFVAEAVPPASLQEQWERIFRAVRSAKGAFGDDLISRVTVIPEYKVRAEVRKLLEMGLVKVIESDQGTRYIGTQILYDTPHVPPMPRLARGIKTGLLKAREAVAELNRLFLTMETDMTGTRKLIKRQLEILNEEFRGGL